MSFVVLGAEGLAANPIAWAGQPIVDALTGVVKVGDGRTPWSELPECPPDVRAQLVVSP